MEARKLPCCCHWLGPDECSPSSKAAMGAQKLPCCCHWLGPDEARQAQRQQWGLKSCHLAASAPDPKKSPKAKGSDGSPKVAMLLPLPRTRRSPPKPKAAMEARKLPCCCHWLGPDEARQDQRQQTRLESCHVAATGSNSMNSSKFKGCFRPAKL